jgi:hypothetical protein
MIKSRRMRWAGHVACMRVRWRRRINVGFWWEVRRKETTRKTQTYVEGCGGIDWIDLA